MTESAPPALHRRPAADGVEGDDRSDYASQRGGSLPSRASASSDETRLTGGNAGSAIGATATTGSSATICGSAPPNAGGTASLRRDGVRRDGPRLGVLVAVGLLALAAVSLMLNAGLLRMEGGGQGGNDAPIILYAEPVDRSRHLRFATSSSREKAEHGSIAVAEMERVPMGSSYKPQWPLFWILTAPQNEATRCEEIMASWGRAVPPDSLVFIGAQQNRTLPSGHRFVALEVPPERKAMKELLAWSFVFKVFPDREWYVKGDDDTFFVPRNLNRYLETFDPRLPYFLGCKFHLGGAGGVQYVSGGAGYALSQDSVRRVASAAERCVAHFGFAVNEGDLAVAECLQTVGVFPEDTRDEQGRQRFHPFKHDYHANWYKYQLHINKFWYHDWVWGGPMIEGNDCCGENTTVSFHYMSEMMRMFQFPPAKRTGKAAEADEIANRVPASDRAYAAHAFSIREASHRQQWEPASHRVAAAASAASASESAVRPFR